MDITSIDDLLYLDRKIPRDDNDIESRQPFIKFLKGLLKIDPAERWTASQAILHPFIQGKPLQEFIPIPSNSYLEVQKNRPVPTGSLRGSCPSLLQQIRGSQDLTLRAHDVCFRPLVEELQDDFFTGFVHGKLVQVQPPPMPNPSTQWNNPFMNIPISFPHNFQHKPHIAKPLPNIVGPRYDRPHSYGTGEEYSHLPRPISPMIEENKYLKKKPRKNPIKKGRSNSSKNTNEHTPKVKSEPIRPNSQDDKKIKPASDKFFPFNTSLIPDITQQTFIPEINSQNIAVKTGDTTKFLDKVRNDLNKK